MNAFVVSGLIKRRAQLAGDIEKAHESLRMMVQDLENLDATILQFEPDFKVETIRPKAFRPPKDWSARDQAELRAGLEAQIAALEEARAGLQARAEQAEAELQRARTGPGKAAGPAAPGQPAGGTRRRRRPPGS